MPAPHRSVFLQAGCPSCRPTNSVKALKALCCVEHGQKNSYTMLAIKITPNLLFEYQCTSGKFIRLPNRIEKICFGSENQIETIFARIGMLYHSLSLASVKSRLVLLFWYRLTRVVPEKGLLSGCVCVVMLSAVGSSVDQASPSHRRLVSDANTSATVLSHQGENNTTPRK